MKLVFSSFLVFGFLFLVLFSIIQDGLDAASFADYGGLLFSSSAAPNPPIHNSLPHTEPPYKNPRSLEQNSGFTGPTGEPRIIGPSSNPPNY